MLNIDWNGNGKIDMFDDYAHMKHIKRMIETNKQKEAEGGSDVKSASSAGGKSLRSMVIMGLIIILIAAVVLGVCSLLKIGQLLAAVLMIGVAVGTYFLIRNKFN